MSAEKYRKPCDEQGCSRSEYQRKKCYHHYRKMRIAEEPDFLEKESAKQRRQRENNPESARQIKKRSIVRRYGLTVEMHDDMVDSCMGLCEICQEQPEPQMFKGQMRSILCIDHDHETGVVRGLLCKKCNSAIAYLRENTSILQSAITYLVKHGKPPPEDPAAF